jgi:hypothetical protein
MKLTHFGFSWLAAAFLLFCFIAVCQIRPVKAQEAIVVDQKSIAAKIKNEVNIKIGGQIFPGVVMWQETKEAPKYRIITDKKMMEIAKDEKEATALAQQCKILCVSDLPTKTIIPIKK